MKFHTHMITWCKLCNRTGQIAQSFFDGTEKTVHSRKCFDCDGHGYVKPCDRRRKAKWEAKKRFANG